MKAVVIALAALAVALVLPAAVNAQDWVMDWHSTGSVVTNPFTWNTTGTSPATLTPVSGGLPPSFSGQAFDLGFGFQGQSFGGRVAQGSFQTSHFSVPAPVPAFNNRFDTDFASGDFNLTGNTFTLHAFLGPGHNHAEFTATGHRSGVTAGAPEPGVLLLGAAGLLGAAVMRRRRRR
jgi:MYXO-CTERM domain-containing protein